MSQLDDDITAILAAEGGPTNDPLDRGGRTAFGISEKSNPEAWKNGPPTEAQARAIYMTKYVVTPGFDKITDPQLQSQLIDFGVVSGPAIAIQKLQTVLKVAVDGVLGASTLAALSLMHPEDVNEQLVAERIRMIGRIVQKNPSQLKYLSGWLNRALSFLR